MVSALASIMKRCGLDSSPFEVDRLSPVQPDSGPSIEMAMDSIKEEFKAI